ncbi:hypothetical protein V6R21_19070 [Limibacter armeniacum]|uniref:hypothetical protein n=1 Tax=Limibacter armeniacum TaxID=466084 RepID=UPI002FE537B2
MARKDILLDEDHNPQIINGDFVVGESDEQHIELLMQSAKGDWRESPVLGVEAINHREGNSKISLKRDIERNLELDGYLGVDIDILDDFSVIINQGDNGAS